MLRYSKWQSRTQPPTFSTNVSITNPHVICVLKFTLTLFIKKNFINPKAKWKESYNLIFIAAIIRLRIICSVHLHMSFPRKTGCVCILFSDMPVPVILLHKVLNFAVTFHIGIGFHKITFANGNDPQCPVTRLTIPRNNPSCMFWPLRLTSCRTPRKAPLPPSFCFRQL